MTNRQTGPYLEINTSDIYCLIGNRTGMLFAGFDLTSVLRPPPPPPTSPLTLTTHYDKTTLKVLVVSAALLLVRASSRVAGYCC